MDMEPFPRRLDDETLETLRRIHAELELDEHVSTCIYSHVNYEHIFKIKMYTILLSGELMIPISIVEWILLVALELMLFDFSLYQLCC
jgi:hypothetical protein